MPPKWDRLKRVKIDDLRGMWDVRRSSLLKADKPTQTWTQKKTIMNAHDGLFKRDDQLNLICLADELACPVDPVCRDGALHSHCCPLRYPFPGFPACPDNPAAPVDQGGPAAR